MIIFIILFIYLSIGALIAVGVTYLLVNENRDMFRFMMDNLYTFVAVSLYLVMFWVFIVLFWPLFFIAEYYNMIRMRKNSDKYNSLTNFSKKYHDKYHVEHKK